MQRNLARLAGVVHVLLRGEPQVIVECGARDCRDTLDFAGLYPRASIYAFECNPDTLPHCRKAVAGHRNVHLIEAAVSDRGGRVPFYAIDASATGTWYNPGASSLLRASGTFAPDQYVQRETEVDALTLEQFLAERNLPAVDILWMDIQGAELAALRGLGKRLTDVKLMHMEVEFEEIYLGQPLFPAIRRFLSERGFAFLGFTNYSRHEADAVFANRRDFDVVRLMRALVANPLLVRKRLTYLRHRLKHRLSA